MGYQGGHATRNTLRRNGREKAPNTKKHRDRGGERAKGVLDDDWGPVLQTSGAQLTGMGAPKKKKYCD
jgi:hypothetical protein